MMEIVALSDVQTAMHRDIQATLEIVSGLAGKAELPVGKSYSLAAVPTLNAQPAFATVLLVFSRWPFTLAMTQVQDPGTPAIRRLAAPAFHPFQAPYRKGKV